jgi:hypothetical protein
MQRADELLAARRLLVCRLPARARLPHGNRLPLPGMPPRKIARSKEKLRRQLARRFQIVIAIFLKPEILRFANIQNPAVILRVGSQPMAHA